MTTTVATPSTGTRAGAVLALACASQFVVVLDVAVVNVALPSIRPISVSAPTPCTGSSSPTPCC